MIKRRTYESTLIILSTSAYMTAFTGSRPLITLYASEQGAGYSELGIMVTLFSVMPLLMSVYLGKKIDRVGQWKPLVLSTFLGSLSLIIPWVIGGLPSIYLSQILGGLAQITFVVSFQSYISRHSKRKIRDYFISIFSIGMALGQFIGPLIGGLMADYISYAGSIGLLGASLFIAIVPMKLMKIENVVQKKPLEKNEDNSHITALLKTSKLRKAFVVSGSILLAKDIFVAYFPLLGVYRGFSNTIIGMIIALNSAAGLIVRILLPALLRIFTINKLTNLTILSAGIIFLLIPVWSNIYTVSFFSLLLGFSLGIGQPLTISMTVNALPSQRVGEGLGLRLTINKLAQVVGPVLLGSVSGMFGIVSIFYLCGITILAGSASFLQKDDNS